MFPLSSSTSDLGQVIFAVKFNYYPLKNLTPSLSNKATGTQKLVYGTTYKRYLKSKYTMNNESQPGIEFIYNWSLNYNQPQGSLYKIIHSNGGQCIFNYKKLQIGISESGSRNQTILNPFGKGGECCLCSCLDNDQNYFSIEHSA